MVAALGVEIAHRTLGLARPARLPLGILIVRKADTDFLIVRRIETLKIIKHNVNPGSNSDMI